jgi:hypothetical protein
MAIIRYYTYVTLGRRLKATVRSTIECDLILYNEDRNFKKECHVTDMIHVVTYSTFIKVYKMLC